jgi:hypothetical protein
MSNLFGSGGPRLLDGLDLHALYSARVTCLLRVTDRLGLEIGVCSPGW